MISLAKMRELIPDSDKYSDDFLIELRKEMEGFADLAFDCWLAERNKEKSS